MPQRTSHRSRGRQRFKSVLFDVFLVASDFALSLPGHRFRVWWLRTIVQAQVGDQVAIQRGVRIRGRGGLSIESGTNINRGVLLDGGGGLNIGAHVNISPEVMLLTTEHDPNSPGFEGRAKAVRIGSRSWIASRSIVLPGAEIGEGAIVGAGAVVRGVVEPWSIVAGNPARVVGQRDQSAQASLAPYRRFLH
jgi:acetyltransferase-like isoleucine patch superfamily enzyme